MTWYELIWEWEEEDGNVAHIAQNDIAPEDVQIVMENPIGEGTSRTSNRPIVFGYTPDGRKIAAILRREVHVES